MTPEYLTELKQHCHARLRELRARHDAETAPYLRTLQHIEALTPPVPLIKEPKHFLDGLPEADANWP